MKIVFTGGGTGGHFYPIIAVAQKVNKIIDEENIIGAKLYYFSDEPYDKEALFQTSLTFEQVQSGKLRLYFSFKNLVDIFKVALGVFKATIKIFLIYPDVVFGKGGYASFPALFAAKILRIPVIIHESDSAPGRVNNWAGKFANKIAVSFNEAAHFFPKEKVAWTGQPIRAEIEHVASKEEGLKFYELDHNIPTILILGGSQGAELINNVILDILPNLLNKYQVIHQTGVKNFKNTKARSDFLLTNIKEKDRYKIMPFLNPLQMKMASGACDLIISRAGSFLFEIALWGIPSILIPITVSNMDHQRKNAYNYARAGGCSVVEELNMTPNILFNEISRIIEDKSELAKMKENALAFSKKDAAYKIAKQIINIAMSHEA